MELDLDLLFLFLDLDVGLVALFLPPVPFLYLIFHFVAHVISPSADHLDEFLTSFGVVDVVGGTLENPGVRTILKK